MGTFLTAGGQILISAVKRKPGLERLRLGSIPASPPGCDQE